MKEETKTVTVLFLFTELREKKVYMDSFIERHNISIPTFKRYISEIRDFLCEKKCGEELIYDRVSNTYFIISSNCHVSI